MALCNNNNQTKLYFNKKADADDAKLMSMKSARNLT